MKYYAVKKGKHPGIYTTWKDCQKDYEVFGAFFYGNSYYSTNSEVQKYLHLYNKGKKERGKYEY